MEAVKSIFETLNEINVNDKTEKKGELTYLSWSWAWQSVKKAYPNANYEIKKFEHNLPYVYDPNTGYMVFTSVTIDEITHEMWLPVMDNRNKAMLNASMTDINKTIMRCLTKNLAMHGLGLYIYAGEDMPQIDLTLEEAINQIQAVNDCAWIEQYAAWAHNELPQKDKDKFAEAVKQYQNELKAKTQNKPFDFEAALSALHNAENLDVLEKYFKSATKRAETPEQKQAIQLKYEHRKADFLAEKQE